MNLRLVVVIGGNNIMAQYIDKDVVAEIKDLYEDIDKCIGDLVLARSKHDQRGISDAHWKMETLMVNTQQVFSYILQHLEVKAQKGE